MFLTDSAVGAREENNLRHLVINLGTDVPRDHVVPFLTTKHSLDFCLSLRRARLARRVSDRSSCSAATGRSAPPRCVEHAWQLREAIREHVPGLTLGGWANPHANPATQVDYLGDARFTGEFFLTQVVSHHDAQSIERFLIERERQRLTLPGVFGVFYYRSANPTTLETLRQFLPVPVDGLIKEFGAGASADEICARTIRDAARGRGAAFLRVESAGGTGQTDVGEGTDAGRVRRAKGRGQRAKGRGKGKGRREGTKGRAKGRDEGQRRGRRRSRSGGRRPELSDGDGEHRDEFACFLNQWRQLSLPLGFGRQEPQPVSGLSRFAQRHRVLRGQVAAAVGHFGLFEHRADTCGRF